VIVPASSATCAESIRRGPGIVQALVPEPAEMHRFQQFRGAGAAGLPGDAARPQRELHVLGRGQPREQGRLLEHERDLPAGGVDRARGRLVQPRHQGQQRALAAPGRADEADELAERHLQRHPVERVHRVPAVAEDLGHPADPDGGGPVRADRAVAGDGAGTG